MIAEAKQFATGFFTCFLFVLKGVDNSHVLPRATMWRLVQMLSITCSQTDDNIQVPTNESIPIMNPNYKQI